MKFANITSTIILARVIKAYRYKGCSGRSYAAIGHVGVQPSVHNMAAFLNGYAKIVSEDESKHCTLESCP